MSACIDFDEVARFLVEAKRSTYAGEGTEEKDPQRPGFKELVYRKDLWVYRDSYIGYYQAQGQELVHHEGITIWSMSYHGGMLTAHHGNKEFSTKTFSFLKEALFRIPIEAPYRGPTSFTNHDYHYINEFTGDHTSFRGVERIFYQDHEVYNQDYCGGIII